ncbi:hypothetical protein ACFYW8_13400 [Streptomyces sp. NPDC002742]|uniref:hypothetical protein n=1 Tax=Streptomyces sp. NPDC002742 TaxID=3364663 RepID=UPI0036854864
MAGIQKYVAAAGTPHGRLPELAGDLGWGVRCVGADLPAHSDGLDVRRIVVRGTEGAVHSRLDLN